MPFPKIVRQRRHVTNGQFTDLAAADPLGFLDRSIAVLKNAPGIDKKRLACGRQRDALTPSLKL